MNNDLELAELLGEAPARAPDPGFRFDVFARIALKARRAQARRKAMLYAAAFAAIGIAVPLLRAAGFSLAEPLLAVAAGVGVAYVLALLSQDGPDAALARSRRLLRMGL